MNTLLSPAVPRSQDPPEMLPARTIAALAALVAILGAAVLWHAFDCVAAGRSLNFPLIQKTSPIIAAP